MENAACVVIGFILKNNGKNLRGHRYKKKNGNPKGLLFYGVFIVLLPSLSLSQAGRIAPFHGYLHIEDMG